MTLPDDVGFHLIRQDWPAAMESEPSGLLMGFSAANTVEAKAAHTATAEVKKRILLDFSDILCK